MGVTIPSDAAENSTVFAYSGSKKYREGKVRERRGRGGIEGKNKDGMVNAVAKVCRLGLDLGCGGKRRTTTVTWIRL